MGTDYTCHALIGYPITFSAADYAETVVRQSCEHEERFGKKFCPVCGTKVADRSHVRWDNKLMETIYDNYSDETCRNIIMVLTEEDRKDAIRCLVGYGTSVDPKRGESNSLALLTMDEIGDRIRRFLDLNGFPEQSGSPGCRLYLTTQIS